MSPPDLSSNTQTNPSLSPMAANHHHGSVAAFLPLRLLLIFASSCVEAQSPLSSNESRNSTNSSIRRGNFNPTTAMIIVLAVSTLFFLAFFLIYIYQYGNSRSDDDLAAAARAINLQRYQRGLDPSVLETVPILVYSKVKEHKIGKCALECAICLIEFEDDDTIRLLPRCDHVFHQSCIDAWLVSHVTCPVCRTNYATYSPDALTPTAAARVAAVMPAAAVDDVEISVDEEEERKAEMIELARIASSVRGNGSRWSRRLTRSHSTGHSEVMRKGEGAERYTLRLPENLRNEIIAAGKMQRATTFGGTEGSSRGEVGEGNSHRRRSLKLGRLEMWPSFFRRSMSAARVSMWSGSLRQGEEVPVQEGSSTAKGGLMREALVKEETIRGKLASARSSLDCLGGGGAGSKDRHNVDPEEWSTAPLNRI